MSLKVSGKRIVIYMILMLTILSCTLPFNLGGREATQPPMDLADAIVPPADLEPLPSATVTLPPTATMTETPLPTATMTATPDPFLSLPTHVQEALLWETSFYDDFSDNSQGWWVQDINVDDFSQRRDITNGLYSWNLEIIEIWDDYLPFLGIIPARLDVQDFYAATSVQLVEGYDQTAYGLVFRMSFDGHYAFTIRQASYQLSFYDQEQYIPIIDWTFSELINPGQMNELAVSANGDHISLFINGEMVADLTDNRSPGGNIFLTFDLNVSGEQATLAFDDVLIKTRAASLYQEARQWPLFVEETFETNANLWATGPVSNAFFDAEYTLADGKYVIDARAKQGFIQISLPEDVADLTDFYLTADVSLADGADSADYGLVFRSSADGYYYYKVFFREFGPFIDVQAYYNGEWIRILPPINLFWLNVEKGDLFSMGVIAEGERFVILLNDTVLAEFRDALLPAGQAGIGFGISNAGDAGVWEFSNFNIAVPEDSPGEILPPMPTATSEPRTMATPTVSAQTGLSEAVNPQDNANMVFVPAGEFLMGYAGGEDDEQPEHLVYLDDYWLYQTPVTNSQYRQCIINGGCTGTLSRFADDQLPVVRIDWDQAVAYCGWAGGRLPTEAEWEKGARGSDGRLYPWGSQSPTCLLSSYLGCFPNQLTPVGQLPDGASPYGALDMLGLVWEWVSDWYDAKYYANSPYENPTGPVMGTFRVQRGHSFESNQIYLRITDRASSNPFSTDYRKGFRCVLTELP